MPHDYSTSPELHTDDAFAQLAKLLHENRSVMCGLSGAGKSTLLNLVIPGLELRVGSLSLNHLSPHACIAACRERRFADISSSPPVALIAVLNQGPIAHGEIASISASVIGRAGQDRPQGSLNTLRLPSEPNFTSLKQLSARS